MTRQFDYLAHALVERPNLAGLNVIVGMDYLKLGRQKKPLLTCGMPWN